MPVPAACNNICSALPWPDGEGSDDNGSGAFAAALYRDASCPPRQDEYVIDRQGRVSGRIWPMPKPLLRAGFADGWCWQYWGLPEEDGGYKIRAGGKILSHYDAASFAAGRNLPDSWKSFLRREAAGGFSNPEVE